MLVGAGKGAEVRSQAVRATLAYRKDNVKVTGIASWSQTTQVRVGAGASYRCISGAGESNADLRGPSASITLKFGKF